MPNFSLSFIFLFFVVFVVVVYVLLLLAGLEFFAGPSSHCCCCSTTWRERVVRSFCFIQQRDSFVNPWFSLGVDANSQQQEQKKLPKSFHYHQSFRFAYMRPTILDQYPVFWWRSFYISFSSILSFSWVDSRLNETISPRSFQQSRHCSH